jgi:predicted amidohydrolase YtcJ
MRRDKASDRVRKRATRETPTTAIDQGRVSESSAPNADLLHHREEALRLYTVRSAWLSGRRRSRAGLLGRARLARRALL